MNPILFIELRRLGSIVEARVRQVLTISDKRKRKAEVKKLVNLLRYLVLLPTEIPEDEPVIGIALGIRADGELGLWVIYESPTKIQGDIGS